MATSSSLMNMALGITPTTGGGPVALVMDWGLAAASGAELLEHSLSLPEGGEVDESTPVTLCLDHLLFDAWLVDRRGQVGRARFRKPRQPRCRRRLRKCKRAGQGCHIPEAIGKGDKCHKEAGLWTIDTVNPNCAAGALQHLESSAADFCLVQEVRTESREAQERAVELLYYASGGHRRAEEGGSALESASLPGVTLAWW